MRALGLLSVALLAGVAVWLLADRGTSSDEVEVFDRQGLVTRVVDGDTLRARIGASTERVRLIGIDSPERGECYSMRASALLRLLALGRVVRLLGDATQDARDRFGRLLAYVVLPGGDDAGLVLLARGAAVVFETRPPFSQHGEYSEAQTRAARRAVGLHGACR